MSTELAEYKTKITGVSFEGRQEIVAMLKGDEPLQVRREADNKFDPQAVAVDVEIAETWHPIGYIAKDKNKDISAALDADHAVTITMAGLTGGTMDSNGKPKTRGVNIALIYEKAKVDKKPTSKAKTAPESSHKATEHVSEPSESDSILNKIKSLLGVESKTEIYTSRLIGKSTTVHVNDGHVGIPGYLSGSAFPKKFYAEFDEDEMLTKIVEKHYGKSSIEEKEKIKTALLSMWGLNRDASTGYGTAIHAALENFITYQQLGDKTKKVEVLKTKTNTGPNKALSRNPFLKKIVEDFWSKFGDASPRLCEQFIWEHGEGLCGSIDLVKVIDADKKIIRIQDFKTDGDIHETKYQLPESIFRGVGKAALKKGTKEKPNTVEDTLLGLHWLQLSFYAYILTTYYGYTVEGLDIYWLNPNKLCKGENAWEEFSHEVINIEGGL